ncbi:acetylglutamate kinase [Metabacillus indicus]|uniref:acetylglutamate kinase n=1 Tax=Metabacillus indicus TaxID=246786 RepID=UPI003CE68556
MDRTVVLKCGGSTVDELSSDFFESLHELISHGHRVVIVHGGGPAINAALKSMNVQTEFIGGQRKTTKQVLDVAEMVLAGQINKQLVRALQQHGFKAAGIAGCDGGTLTGEHLNEQELGHVGQITAVDDHLIKTLLKGGYIPVIAPLAKTKDHGTLNVNADTAAAAVASALQANQLLFVTDVEGIMKEQIVIQHTTPDEIAEMIGSGMISGGMIPKVEAAIKSLSQTLKEVMIVSGKRKFASEASIFGTKITAGKEAALK